MQLLDLPIPMILPGGALGHGINLPIAELGTAAQWFTDRFNGVLAPSNCRTG